MATLDSSIVNIALPTLTKELSPDLHQIKWIVIIYLLMITCLLLPFGRLSDQQGRKPVFQTGFLIFIFGSALCGMAPSLSTLVAFRAIQAVGAAMLMANGPAIITSAFSTKERGKALGTLAMVVSLGLVSGPMLGGIVITYLGWRTIFWLNIPIGIFGIFLAQRFLKADHPARSNQRFDWKGAFFQTLILILLIVFFEPPRIAISNFLPFVLPRWVIGTAIIGLTLIFLKIESGVRDPLFDLSLLKNRTFWAANLAGFLTFVAFSSVTVLMPFFLEEVLHFSTHRAGVFMAAIPLTIFVVAPVSGRLSDRLGTKELSVLGSMIGMLALFAMSGVFGRGIYEGTGHGTIVFSLCVIGLAIGLFQSPNNNAIMGAVPVQKLGVASALLATVRNLGLVTGTGLSASLLSWGVALKQEFISAFHLALFVAGLICGGALVASLSRKSALGERGEG